MNTSVEGIIVNDCQYTPIYLLQDPGSTQANTFFITSSALEQSKPVSDNLKTFYESSGNIENGLVSIDTAVRPLVVKTVKRKENILIGNNLKLANFLTPKTENVYSEVKKKHIENIVAQPNVSSTAISTTATNSVPIIDFNRKIVKLKEVPMVTRTRRTQLPKIKPRKDKSPSPTPVRSKHTSVQLIKLGGTYHSINNLSDDQIKMVNQALKMFDNPDKISEPTYDPVTNTKYFYKVVSPKDLKVVGKKKLIAKEKKGIQKAPKKVEEKPIREEEEDEDDYEPEPPAEEKVTRSGRKVKFPKQILPEESPQKTKRKCGTIVTCFQCSTDFGSLYRLQKHYENHPTHIPAKIHSNLFHCLLAIVKSGSEEDKTNIFIQQLEQLIVKLKSLLPCLLKDVGSEGQSCTINSDIGRLFGVIPGKYNIDVDALNCVKDKNGYCIHNPPKPQTIKEYYQPNNIILSESDSENCARINSVAKWPTVSKRLWKMKQKNGINAKKMRLKSEEDSLIDLGTEDLIFTAINEPIATTMPKETVLNSPLIETPKSDSIVDKQINNVPVAETCKPKNNYIQFHSAHFDIRSSPIKASTSTIFTKFQIDPSKMSTYEVIRPLEMGNDKEISHNGLQEPENVHSSLTNSENELHTAIKNSTDIHVTLPNSNNIQSPLLNSTNTTSSDSSLCLPINGGIHVSLTNSDNLHVPLSSPHSLHITLPNSDNLNVDLQNSDHDIHLSLPNSNDSIHLPMANSDNSLHDLFKDDVDLSKDTNVIDSELKDWIISTSEKSENTFGKSNNLIGSALLHVTNCDEKSISEDANQGMPSLDCTDSRLLSNQGESVLNFLDNLSNDLAYPETDIRNNSVDFQLDLFTFHNT